MTDRPIKTCVKENCTQCDIRHKTNCRFSLGQLLRFYLIAFPSFIIGGIGIYRHHFESLYLWLLIIGVFFLLVEIRVLCSHCPHYEKSSTFLRCWANYGAPKLWQYRPGPMNVLEKSILMAGFVIVWGYPLIFLYLSKRWALLVLYLFATAFFFVVLRRANCRKCINLSCPLNNMDADIKTKFLGNNPMILQQWKDPLK